MACRVSWPVSKTYALRDASQPKGCEMSRQSRACSAETARRLQALAGDLQTESVKASECSQVRAWDMSRTSRWAV